MNLRRPVSSRMLTCGFAALMAGAAGYSVSLQFTAGASVTGRLYAGAISLIALLMTAAFVRYAVQQFRIDVDQDGWTVRIGRYRRYLRWAEISTVVIENAWRSGSTASTRCC